MKILQTPLADCVIIEPNVISDERGYFMESFNERLFQKETGQEVHFVQDNQSHSSKGVLRGLHYQTGHHVQAKLVRVIIGAVLDIVVDIRPNSETFGQHYAIELSAENQLQLYIPRGFAHGFLVLSDTALFFYKCDNYYHSASEAGIIYNDPVLAIDWQLPDSDLLISGKDQILPNFKNAQPIW